MTAPLFRFDPTFSDGEIAAWEPHLEIAGWSRTWGDDWKLYMARALPPNEVYRALTAERVVNRFPGIGGLSFKTDLLANLRWARRWSGHERFDFHPRTFLIPGERRLLVHTAATDPEAVWILKPAASTRGRGIRLLGSLDELPNEGDWLVQEYVRRPHLIDDRKYNLRFYLLLTSVDPLVCWLHDRGTCRFSARPYSLAPGAFDDPIVHLTNTAIQAHHRESPWWERDTDLAGYRGLLRDRGLDEAALMTRIRDALAHLVIACRDQILYDSRTVTQHLERCFDFLGVDVQVDEELRPWILEANAGPPMELEPYGDERAAARSRALKDELVRDLLAVTGIAGFGCEAAEAGVARSGWKRLWPATDADRFETAFPLLRPADRETAHKICPAIAVEPQRLAAAPDVDTHRLGEGLALYEPRRCRIYTLTPTAAVLWLALVGGEPIDRVVRDLAAAHPATDPARIQRDLWDLLTAWAQIGLLAGFQASPVKTGEPASTLVVPAVHCGETLVVDLDPDGVPAGSEVTLPDDTVRRLDLVAGEDPPDDDAASSPAAALDSLFLAARDWEARRRDRPDAPPVLVDREGAERLVRWIDGVEARVLGRRPAEGKSGRRITAGR